MKRLLLVVSLTSLGSLAGCCHNRPLFGGNPYANNCPPQYYAQPVQQPAPQAVQYVQPQVQYMQQPQMVCPQVCPQVCPPVCPPCY
jgi:hypothetical protein